MENPLILRPAPAIPHQFCISEYPRGYRFYFDSSRFTVVNTVTNVGIEFDEDEEKGTVEISNDQCVEWLGTARILVPGF